MYNKYIGNTGKYIRVDDAPPCAEPADAGVCQSARLAGSAPAVPLPTPAAGLGPLHGLLKSFMPAGSGLDVGDIILLLLLFLLYIDSGDDEFLVLLGCMVFAMFKKRPS
ncbi:MAG: hypothetical protein LBS51_05670 [Oscillospiraceae bacterium]|jgi:hypothetical protein|nr:hypothetical protein [Oscillospiraceae bacterium]